MNKKSEHEIDVENAEILSNKIIEMFVEEKASLSSGCMAAGLIISHSLSKAGGKKESLDIRKCIIEMMDVTILSEYD